MNINMYELIDKKKNGGELSKEELYYIVNSYTEGRLPDYQMSAFLMAVCLKGMTREETFYFTMAMKESGDELDLSSIRGRVIDKHSTGGVGDKVSLALGPLAAACGVPVAKMSGRGLGHTGGTIDKLESFKGFNVSPTEAEFIKNVNDIGIAWSEQTGNLAPADKKIYALRDVTATVDSIPLIASSIMSKKLASGAAGIVLDVTFGLGAFMPTFEKAKELAGLMVDIGRQQGREMAAVITRMDEPLGYAVGNNLEVIEAIECLKGHGPKDVMEVTIALASHMLVMGKICTEEKEAKKLLLEKIADGSALKKFKQWVERQGGDGAFVEDTELFEKARYVLLLIQKGEGYIAQLNGKTIGLAVQALGGGRRHKEDKVDLSVGVRLCKKVGDKAAEGETLAYIYANDMRKGEEALDMVKSAYVFSERPKAALPVVLTY